MLCALYFADKEMYDNHQRAMTHLHLILYKHIAQYWIWFELLFYFSLSPTVLFFGLCGYVALTAVYIREGAILFVFLKKTMVWTFS